MVQWMVDTNRYALTNKSNALDETMHFFSLHLLREDDTVKSLQMTVAVTKYRYRTFQVELSTLNSTRFDSVRLMCFSAQFDSVPTSDRYQLKF